LVYTKVLTQELQVSVGSMKQDRNPRRNHWQGYQREKGERMKRGSQNDLAPTPNFLKLYHFNWYREDIRCFQEKGAFYWVLKQSGFK
jgi:hypothetical protein